MKRQILLISAVFVLQMKRSVIPPACPDQSVVPIISGILIGTAYFILPTISCAQNIAAGGYHSLALCGDSTVQAWGANFYSQLGNGTDTGSNIPEQVSSLTGITAISGGEWHSLALKNNGTAWAWGYNSYGQIGNGTDTISNVPVQVSSLTAVTAITAGGYGHSLALKNDGTVWAWGSNAWGQLGDGTNTDSHVPIQVSSLTAVIEIAGGKSSSHSLALRSDSTVWAWGRNAEGQLGNGTNFGSNIPVQVVSISGIAAIAEGNLHSVALKNDGTVWTWGYNYDGELGNGTIFFNSNVPVQVSNLTGIIAIAAGDKHSLALKNDGTVWAWGYNGYGQLGNGSYFDTTHVAVQVIGLTGAIAIGGGIFHSLALKNDGTVWAWGSNIDGELGNGTDTNSNVPVQVIGLCQIATSVNNAFLPTAGLSMTVSVFPNPVSGNSFINYTLSTPATVSIALYDVLGNKLQQIVNGGQEQGEHTTALDARNLPNGIYVLQIRAGEQMAEQKVVVMN